MRFISRLLLLIVFVAPSFAQQPPKASVSNTIPVGSLTDGIYRNEVFGFSYKLPFGWVDRTEEMRQSSPGGEKSQVLLAVFERPPEASARSVNSAVIISAESVSSYPGLKSAAQYFGPLTQLTTAKGFKVVNEPYEFPVDAKPIVRADFIKQLPSVTMYQSSLAMLSKGYALSFTFLSGSDDEVTGLLDGLSFGKLKKPSKAASQP